MTEYIVVFDDSKSVIKRSSLDIASVSGETNYDNNYDVGAGGETYFNVTNGSFTPTSKIDVFYNGIKMREGASDDYTRDVFGQTIIFNYTVPENSWVLVRIIGD